MTVNCYGTLWSAICNIRTYIPLAIAFATHKHSYVYTFHTQCTVLSAQLNIISKYNQINYKQFNFSVRIIYCVFFLLLILVQL